MAEREARTGWSRMTRANEKKPGLARVLFSRTLHTYFLMRRGLTLGVRAIVRSNDGKFLLVRHSYTPGWYFPGGGVEKGKTTEQALRDEVRQETNLWIIGKPVMHGVFYNNSVSKRDHVLAYLCDVQGSIEAQPKSMEIAEIGYFSFEDLPLDTEPGTLRRIHEIVSRVEITERW
jgi:8-oxo-dGTP pyrophosphatase MutT (NUDIX family)